MVEYYIKKKIEKYFNMDKGEEVSNKKYTIYSNSRLIVFCLIIDIIILSLGVLFWITDSILIIKITLSLICLFLIYESIKDLIINPEIEIASFDSRVKAENYIKYLKKNE